MAESDFWQSMVNAAKAKTAEIVEFVKNDMNELSTAVNSEVHYYTDIVKREANTFLGNVRQSLNFNRDSDPSIEKKSVRSFIKDLWSPETVNDEVRPIMIVDSEPVPMTDVQYKHHLLVTDPDNFVGLLSEDEQQQFEAWCMTGNQTLDVDCLSKQLSDCPALGDMYRQLVPDQVSHSEFWRRYFFKRSLILDSSGNVENELIVCHDNFSSVTSSEIADLVVSVEESKKSFTSIPEYLNREDEFFTVEIEAPFDPSSARTNRNDWDIEFEIERVKETNVGSLDDILLAD